MRKIERIMVALDLSERDDELLKFANSFAKMLHARQLICVHVVPVLALGGIVKFAVGEILTPVAPALGKLQEELETKTRKWVDKKGLETKVMVVEGRPYYELLRMLEESATDLLVIGKKKLESGSGLTAKRVVRHTKSDVLFVPELEQKAIQRIVVPIDFSSNAARAIEVAISLAFHLNLKEKPTCINILDLPAFSDNDSTLPFVDVSNDLPKSAKKRFKDFLEKYKIESSKINCTFIKTKRHTVAQSIRDFAQFKHADLIVMGAKGHNVIERFLVGSVAEAMVDSDFDVPIFIVR